jgi:hypothetical protein
MITTEGIIIMGIIADVIFAEEQDISQGNAGKEMEIITKIEMVITIPITIVTLNVTIVEERDTSRGIAGRDKDLGIKETEITDLGIHEKTMGEIRVPNL